jgi:hypothetical protein
VAVLMAGGRAGHQPVAGNDHAGEPLEVLARADPLVRVAAVAATPATSRKR